LIAILVACYAGPASVSKGQTPPTPPTPAAPAASTYGAGTTFFKYSTKGGPRGEKGAAASLRQAADAVHNAKGDEKAGAGKKKLTTLIDKLFDEDMKQREKELADLEKRLSKLREQLERRRTKKQDIVDLQLKVVLNEADGLGFFSGNSAKGNFDLTFREPIS